VFSPTQLIKRVGRQTLNAAGRGLARSWRPYSRLILVDDSPLWVLAWEMRELAALARRLGVRLAAAKWQDLSERQAIFFASQFILLTAEVWPGGNHAVGAAYFHGKPGTGVPEFDACYARLRQMHSAIQRIQVSHTEMRDIVLESGIAPEKVFLIPIGINLSFFRVQTSLSRREARAQLGIPESAVVVGSFQKDGNGWGEGLEPKLIKGPDVFLNAVALLQQRIPELFVLLSGPARGYVKAGLERLRVPYKHLYLSAYPEVGQLFQALDVYLVASRQEGGPKAVLEAMASGVPLVTTRVGQAMDLVQHEENGWMVASEDAEGLAYWAAEALTRSTRTAAVLIRGRRTAEANTYEAQLPLWRSFMQGFVRCNS
jgi:glycosyltransferase involved in cell wall biosynthesis